MKVLHVLDTILKYKQSGYTIRSNYILNTQQAMKFNPTALSRESAGFDKNGAKALAAEHIDGVRYLLDPGAAVYERMTTRLHKHQLLGTPRILQYGLMRRLAERIDRAIQEEAPDVIHVASPAMNALTAIDVGHRCGLPVVYEARGLWHESLVAQGMLDPKSQAYQMRERMFVNAIQQSDAVVVLSEALKSECVNLGLSENKGFIVPNGVDLQKCSIHDRQSDLAERLNIESEDVVFGYIGLVRSLEGLDLLLSAIQKLRQKYPNAKLLIVGGGRELPALQEKANALNLGHAVIFTGQVPHSEVGQYYSLLDVFVIPRTRSRVTELVTPIKPYEAMAMEKALVVSDVRALCEDVDDGKTGLVFQAGDVSGLVEVCERLLKDRALRMQLGKAGRKWVLNNRSWEKVVARYHEVYARAQKETHSTTCASIQKTRRKSILLYSQHLIGVGHHARNVQIAQALAKSHDVFFVDGGRPVPGMELPEQVTKIPLPSLKMEAGRLLSPDPDKDIKSVLAERLKQLRSAISDIAPDVLLIEFFPFGRWALRPEILATIDLSRRKNAAAQVLCSLRDIPTRLPAKDVGDIFSPQHQSRRIPQFDGMPSKPVDQQHIQFGLRYYEEVCPTLNAAYDVLLIHGDPKVSRLEDHFPWIDDISIPTVYTGFISQKLREPDRNNQQQEYVLVSAGGGAEAYEVVKPCIEAWKQLQKRNAIGKRKMAIFTGAFVDEEKHRELKNSCADGAFSIERFAPDFLQRMQDADLSISRAGYNTCMNVLETGVRAIFVPSIAMGDQEYRAQRLSELGIADVIAPNALSSEKLAQTIQTSLNKPRPVHDLNLDGAEQTRRIIEAL